MLWQLAHLHTVFLIVEEHFFHAQGHRLVVEENVGLEVIVERAEVDVGRAARGETVVGH